MTINDKQRTAEAGGSHKKGDREKARIREREEAERCSNSANNKRTQDNKLHHPVKISVATVSNLNILIHILCRI